MPICLVYGKGERFDAIVDTVTHAAWNALGAALGASGLYPGYWIGLRDIVHGELERARAEPPRDDRGLVGVREDSTGELEAFAGHIVAEVDATLVAELRAAWGVEIDTTGMPEAIRGALRRLPSSACPQARA